MRVARLIAPPSSAALCPAGAPHAAPLVASLLGLILRASTSPPGSAAASAAAQLPADARVPAAAIGAALTLLHRFGGEVPSPRAFTWTRALTWITEKRRSETAYRLDPLEGSGPRACVYTMNCARFVSVDGVIGIGRRGMGTSNVGGIAAIGDGGSCHMLY